MIWFENLKENYKKNLSTFNYANEFMRFMISMFDYKNLPKTLEKRFLEMYLNTYGSVVVGKINDELYCVPPNLSGEIDAYNLGTTSFGVCPIGEIRGIKNVDVVLGLNNSTMCPTFDIYKNAELMSELDVSILTTIKNTRMHPIPIANDTKTKLSLENALKDINDGKVASILSDNLLKELDNQAKAIDMINLTDVSQTDKLQYLFHSKDDVLRQFTTHYGQAIQGTGKMAQQTEREIDGSTSFSFIDPIDMLEQRLEMVDNINRIFGTNITVEFSKSWANEWEKYVAISTDESVNGLADESDNGLADESEVFENENDEI